MNTPLARIALDKTASRRLLTLASFAGLLAFAPHVLGQTATGWTGQGNPGTAGSVGVSGGDHWGLQSNWDGTTPGNGARDLYFGSGFDNAGANGSTTSNNNLSSYAGHRINFQNATANGTNPGDHTFTITGNGFTLYDYGGATPAFPQIENDSTVQQIFNLVSSGRAAQTLALSGTGGGGKAEINPVSGALVFSSSTGIDLAGTTQLQIFGGTAGVTFNGVISSSGNSGANGVSLSPGTNQTPTVTFGAANTYAGDTIINSGTLNFALGGSANNSTIRLGNGSAYTATVNLVSATGGQSISSLIDPGYNAATGTYALNSTNYTGTNTVSGNVFLDSSFSVNSVSAGDSRTQLTLSGNISFQNVARTLTVGGAGNTTLSGSFTNVANGASILNKTGTGVLTITGDESAQGTTGAALLKYQVGAGTLSVGSAPNLPTPATGVPATGYKDKVTLSNTATLQATGTFAFGSFTSLTNTVGIQLNGTNTATSGFAQIDVTGNNKFTVAGLISDTGNSLGFTKIGTGTLELTAPNNAVSGQGFRGTANVTGGTLLLDGAGLLTAATVVNGGATLTLDNAIINTNNRIGSGKALTVNGGNFNLTGNAGAATTETVGAVTLGAGGSTVTVTPNAAQAATFTGSTYTRSNGATELFRGTNLGATSAAGVANVTFTTAPTLNATGTSVLGTTTAGVLRGVLVDRSATGIGSAFATYGANGVRVLDYFTEQATNYATAATGDNVRLSTTQGITGTTTNTLQLDNATSTAIVVTNSGSALNPQNGLLFTGFGNITLNGGTFTQAAGTGDLIVLSTNTGAVVISTALAGGNSSVTIGGNGGGTGTIQLNGAITSNSSEFFNFVGTTLLNASVGNAPFINNGTLKLLSGATLPTNKTVTIANGATLDINNVSQTVGALTNAALASSSLQLGNSTPLTSVVTNSGGTLTNLTVGNNSVAGTFNGTITGAINLIKTGTAIQTLNNLSTYTGSTQVSAGTVQVGVTNALPTSTVVTLGTTGTSGTPSTVSGVLDLNGFNQTVGGLQVASFNTGTANTVANNATGTNGVLTVNTAGSVSFAGILQNTSSAATGTTLGLTKAGSGTQTLTGVNTFTGATLIQNGTLAAAGAGALGSGTTGTVSITVNNGGTLLISNSGNVSTDHVNNAAPITLGGGTISIAGAAEGSRTAAGLGTLALTANSTLNFNQTSGGLLAFGQLIPSNFTLSVTNYIGNGAPNGADQLIFTGDLQPFIDNGQISINGLTGPQLAEVALGNNFYELYSVTAVPEPSTIFSGLLTFGALCYSQRRHARRWLSSRRGTARA